MFKTLYSYNPSKNAFLIVTNPGLEDAILNKIRRGKLLFEHSPSGYLPLIYPDTYVAFDEIANIRGAERLTLLIFVAKILEERINAETVVGVLRDLGIFFKDFSSLHINNFDKIAFRGERREWEYMNQDTFATHKITSIELAQITARELLKGSTYNVDLEKPTLTFRVSLIGRYLFLGWDILGDLNKIRKYRINLHPAGLRPSAAANIINIKEIKGDDLSLMDPMCGTGTIPLEMIASFHRIPIFAEFDEKTIIDISTRLFDEPNTIHKLIRESITNEIEHKIVASDISRKYIEGLKQNLTTYKKHLKQVWGIQIKPNIEIYIRDIIHKKPITNANLVITNPPYGIKTSRLKVLPTLYSALLRYSSDAEASEIRLYTPQTQLIKKLMDNHWELKENYETKLGKLKVDLLIIEKRIK